MAQKHKDERQFLFGRVLCSEGAISQTHLPLSVLITTQALWVAQLQWCYLLGCSSFLSLNCNMCYYKNVFMYQLVIPIKKTGRPSSHFQCLRITMRVKDTQETLIYIMSPYCPFRFISPGTGTLIILLVPMGS